MSLINQALKKEQKRRSLNLRETATDIPVYDSNAMGNGFSPSQQKKSISLSILIGFTGAGVVLLGLGGAFVYFGKAYLFGITATSTPEETAENPSIVSNPLTSNPVNYIIAENEGPLATAPATDADSQGEHNESKGDVVLASVDQSPSSEIAEDPAATTENAESEDTITEIVDVVPEEPQLDFKIQDFVDGLQVFGFRSAGPNTRLLLGGRVFKLDDVVDNERGLVFRGSDGEYLIFEDPSGYLYKKTL